MSGLIGWLRYSVLMIGSLSLISCAVGPNFRSPMAPAVQKYTETPLKPKTESANVHAGEAQIFLNGKNTPKYWWVLFQSPPLISLVRQGLLNSPSVKVAQTALCIAQENLRAQTGFTLFPSVDAVDSASRQRFSAAGFGASKTPPSTFNLFNSQVNVSYVLDIFGGGRRGLEALRAQVDYQWYELEATYLTLASNIVTTAITEASLRDQVQATHALIALQERQLKISQQQFDLGAIAISDVLAQKSALALTKATLPPLEKSLAQSRHALAVLVGDFPGEKTRPQFQLEDLQLPTQLPLTIPSELVRQRPDIQASEALLHQASANIGVATANLLPQLSITGNYGWESNFLDTLFTPSGVVWNITGQALQPLFRGGALFAKRRAAVLAYEQAMAQYRQTVLLAFQNVADSLRAIESDAKNLKAQTEAEMAAKEQLTLIQQQYRLGAVNYLALLNADRDYQKAILSRVQAQAARLTDTVALFQALGGGALLS